MRSNRQLSQPSVSVEGDAAVLKANNPTPKYTTPAKVNPHYVKPGHEDEPIDEDIEQFSSDDLDSPSPNFSIGRTQDPKNMRNLDSSPSPTKPVQASFEAVRATFVSKIPQIHSHSIVSTKSPIVVIKKAAVPTVETKQKLFRPEESKKTEEQPDVKKAVVSTIKVDLIKAKAKKPIKLEDVAIAPKRNSLPEIVQPKFDAKSPANKLPDGGPKTPVVAIISLSPNKRPNEKMEKKVTPQAAQATQPAHMAQVKTVKKPIKIEVVQVKKTTKMNADLSSIEVSKETPRSEVMKTQTSVKDFTMERQGSVQKVAIKITPVKSERNEQKVVKVAPVTQTSFVLQTAVTVPSNEIKVAPVTQSLPESKSARDSVTTITKTQKVDPGLATIQPPEMAVTKDEPKPVKPQIKQIVIVKKSARDPAQPAEPVVISVPASQPVPVEPTIDTVAAQAFTSQINLWCSDNQIQIQTFPEYHPNQEIIISEAQKEVEIPITIQEITSQFVIDIIERASLSAQNHVEVADTIVLYEGAYNPFENYKSINVLSDSSESHSEGSVKQSDERSNKHLETIHQCRRHVDQGHVHIEYFEDGEVFEAADLLEQSRDLDDFRTPTNFQDVGDETAQYAAMTEQCVTLQSLERPHVQFTESGAKLQHPYSEIKGAEENGEDDYLKQITRQMLKSDTMVSQRTLQLRRETEKPYSSRAIVTDTKLDLEFDYYEKNASTITPQDFVKEQRISATQKQLLNFCESNEKLEFCAYDQDLTSKNDSVKYVETGLQAKGSGRVLSVRSSTSSNNKKVQKSANDRSDNNLQVCEMQDSLIDSPKYNQLHEPLFVYDNSLPDQEPNREEGEAALGCEEGEAADDSISNREDHMQEIKLPSLHVCKEFSFQPLPQNKKQSQHKAKEIKSSTGPNKSAKEPKSVSSRKDTNASRRKSLKLSVPNKAPVRRTSTAQNLPSPMKRAMKARISELKDELSKSNIIFNQTIDQGDRRQSDVNSEFQKFFEQRDDTEEDHAEEINDEVHPIDALEKLTHKLSLMQEQEPSSIEIKKVEEMPFKVAEVKETPVKLRRDKTGRKNKVEKMVVETVERNVKKPVDVQVNAQAALLKPVEVNQSKPRRQSYQAIPVPCEISERSSFVSGSSWDASQQIQSQREVQPSEASFIKRMKQSVDYEESESSVGSKASSSSAQPIVVYVFLNEKVGQQVIRGTTKDDPKALAQKFCKQQNLNKSYLGAIKNAITAKQRQMKL